MSDADTNFGNSLNSQKPNSLEIKAPDGSTSFLNKIEFVEGDNITINVDPVDKTIEISSTGGGGGGSNTLDYLVLTNDAFIVQPAVLGSPVSFTRTAEGSQTDAIDEGLTLARGINGALYNIESEEGYDNSTHNSPAGTEWNSDGWGDLLALSSRDYGNLRSVLDYAIGENIVGAELVMHDTINDKYYKFSFSDWGQNNGGSFAYTRTEITDPNYFFKEDYGDQVDVFVADDPEGSGIGITRGENQGIYNPYQEEGWNEDDSPLGTLWNADGWDDLSDLEDRTYNNFYDAVGQQLGQNVPGAELVMYLPSEEKYYAIKFTQWTQGSSGGGFAYVRYEINQDEINEGLKFPDGTILKTALGVGRLKSTASGQRRIEEVSGSKNVSVTAITTTSLSTTLSRSQTNSNAIWIDVSSSEIDEILNDLGDYNIWDYSSIEFSLDNSTWYKWALSTGTVGSEKNYSLYDANLTYNLGDTVYFRYNTGGQPQVWWDKNQLPTASSLFRGAIIDYHAFTGEGTFIGTIYIVDDDGEENISHTEVSSGTSDSENDDLWLVQDEGTISYRRMDGEAKTLKIHWTAKVFYGDEIYD